MDYSFKRQPLSLFIQLILHYKAETPPLSWPSTSPARSCQSAPGGEPVSAPGNCPCPAVIKMSPLVSWTLPLSSTLTLHPCSSLPFTPRSGHVGTERVRSVHARQVACNRHDTSTIQEVESNFPSRVYHLTGDVDAVLTPHVSAALQPTVIPVLTCPTY